MQVFHGSYTEIESVDLSKCQSNKDFGRGFYVTKFRKQTEEWAEIMGRVHGTNGVVTEFTFYENAFSEDSLKVLRFNKYDDEWFDFIILNRDEDISELVVEKMVIDFGFDEETAADKFFSSNIFSELGDISTGLYKKTWQEIYDMLKIELK